MAALTFRHKLICALFIFSLIPMIVAAAMTATGQHDHEQMVQDSQLAESTRSIEVQLKADMGRFQQLLLTTAHNPAMVEVMRDPKRLDTWKRMLDVSLMNLTATFPGMIDEACRINPVGAELGRVVQGRLAPDAELSADETGNPFFKPTIALAADQVWYQTPYVSPDTKRWVISVSTPLSVDNQDYGIVHFEIPLAYYHKLLRGMLPTDGVLILSTPQGQVLLNSAAAVPKDEPFPDLHTLSADADFQGATSRILGGQSGFADWSLSDHLYRWRYQRAELAPGFTTIILVAVPAVPSVFTQFNPILPPLLLGLVLVMLIASATSVFLIPATTIVKSTLPQAAAPQRKAFYPLLTLLAALLVAMVAASSIERLHEHASQSHQIEVLIARINGLSGLIKEHELQTESDGQVESESASKNLRQQMASVVNTLLALEPDSSTLQLVRYTFQQYDTGLEQLYQLYADGRRTEADAWDKQVDHSHELMLDRLVEAETIYTRAAQQADLLANVGSTATILVAAALMALMFLQIDRVRRQADQAAAQALREREERFRSLVQNAADIILIIDPEGTIQYESPSLETTLGFSPHALHGKKVFQLLDPAESAHAQRFLTDVLDHPQEMVRGEFRARHAGGSCLYLDATANNLLANPSIAGILFTCRNVTERKQLESELAYRASHDPLTQLPNRTLFIERVQQELNRLGTSGQSLAIIFLDLDNFKFINDSLVVHHRNYEG